MREEETNRHAEDAHLIGSEVLAVEGVAVREQKVNRRVNVTLTVYVVIRVGVHVVVGVAVGQCNEEIVRRYRMELVLRHRHVMRVLKARVVRDEQRISGGILIEADLEIRELLALAAGQLGVLGLVYCFPVGEGPPVEENFEVVILGVSG